MIFYNSPLFAEFKETVSVISSVAPHAKMTMPVLQRHPYNLKESVREKLKGL